MRFLALVFLFLVACGTDSGDGTPVCSPANTEIADLTVDADTPTRVFANTSLKDQCDGVEYAAVYALTPEAEPATCADGAMSIKAGTLGFFNSLTPNTKYFIRVCVLLPSGEMSKGVVKEFTTKD